MRSEVALARIGRECKRTVNAAFTLLNAPQLLNSYKGALLDRFKTSKSSFANVLLAAVSRKVRQTSIDFFSRPSHSLAFAQ